MGFAPGTFARAMRDLIEHGFLERMERGGLRGKGKGYNKFRLSRQWLDYQPEDKPLLKGLARRDE